MKVAYITAQTPYGSSEPFVLDEMLMMDDLGLDLLIVPRNPPSDIYHQDAKLLLDKTICLPLINIKILIEFMLCFFKPQLAHLLWMFWCNSRTLMIFAKNILVLPKSFFLAKLMKKQKVKHIHAHWGSTTSTMALAIAEILQIPWSFTLHRWDIAENNMLQEKVKRAVFTRCISKDGRKETIRIVGEEYLSKIIILHMGVRIPQKLQTKISDLNSKFIIACPANMVPVKGHFFLIQACLLLVKAGISNFRCLLFGDGPLEKEIRKQISFLGLGKFVHLVGRIPHEKLLYFYEKGIIDAVVLPSVLTEGGEKEGIPVALMEAMVYQIPVISTKIGGIPELLYGGAGFLIPPSSPEALFKSIRCLIKDSTTKEKIAMKGKLRVLDSFDLRSNAGQLIVHFCKTRLNSSRNMESRSISGKPGTKGGLPWRTISPR